VDVLPSGKPGYEGFLVTTPPEPTLIKPSPLKVLILDDDASNGALVTRLLETAGYQAEHALDPLKALPLLRDGEYSLLVLDQNMPRMDGLTLLDQIRKESDVPVVMLTASDRSSLAVQAIRLGAFDYLTKPVDGQRLIDTVRQAIGSPSGPAARIAHYEIERELGRGGMGMVYVARDPRLDRKVALKVLLPQFAADPAFELRFLGEARSAAKFSHPNIVTVYEAGRFRGRLFMAMEFVEGELLEKFVTSGTPLPTARAFEIGGQIAAALEAMHRAGMVHRDLKPSNLMMTACATTVKVLDFGLARPSEPGSAVGEECSGTLSYSPPEILLNGQSDVRGDIYGLGVVLCELLTGRRAFESRSMFDLINRITEGRAAKPLHEISHVPQEGLDLLRKMTALKPEDRFATMTEVRSAMKTLWRAIGDRRSRA
jgi:serine/threonine protein kinase